MYGLVLEGGGSRGSYQAGVCKAMHDMGMEFSCVAGTSVGALNGAMVVQEDFERLYNLWYNIEPSKVFKLTDDEARGLNAPGYSRDKMYARLKRIRAVIVDRGLDISPLMRMVKENIDERKLRESPVGFGIVTYDLSSRTPLEIYKEDIPEGQIADYLLASASVPGFQLKNIDGKVFIDGGIYNTLPVNLVRDKGINKIFIVRTYGYGRVKRFNTAGLHITEISSMENLGPILDFNTERIRKNLNLGYYDAMRAVKGLKGRKYYIVNKAGEDFFLGYFLGIQSERIKRMAMVCDVEHMPGKRLLFEYILPRMAEILGVPPDATYEELSLALMEKMAESLDVDRFRVYEISEFLSEIAKARREQLPQDRSATEMRGFLRKFDFISRFMKDKIIIRLAGELFDGLIENGSK